MATCTALVALDCSHTAVSSLEGLAHSTALTTLIYDDTAISSLELVHA